VKNSFSATSTGLYMLRCLRQLGLRKNPVGLTPFMGFFSATFFCARKNAPHLSLSGAKKRRIQPERYVQYAHYKMKISLKNELTFMV
jgi:hypothetical protein